ncbi:Zn-ribbon domain-containing OB-fold protein [Paratractidigestivibacter faecalis]|uniref:Zn-ribbon domain-containing OB-fold protein n=1 Tax=Paratractidigestivibacter faecalis TaxID=2292441 RepID=UPI003CFDEB64
MKLEMMEPIVKKFYEGLAEGKFYARRCRECGAVEFPPHLACNACGYHETEWCEVSGHGRLIDFTLPGPQNDKPYLKENGKYAYGAVEIDEGAQYTYVIYGITKKKAPAIRAALMAGEKVGVHAKVIDRPGYKMLTFELD